MIKRPQFTLGALFGIIGSVAAVLAVCRAARWQPEAVVLILMASPGVLLLAWGIFRRSLRQMLSGGAALVLAILIALSTSMLIVAKGSGHQTQSVTVSIIDAKTKLPIPGARAWFCDESAILKMRSPPNAQSTIGVADSVGRCTFTADFDLATETTFLTERGAVVTGYRYLHVEAPGFQSVDVLTDKLWGKTIEFKPGVPFSIPPVTVQLEPVVARPLPSTMTERDGHPKNEHRLADPRR